MITTRVDFYQLSRDPVDVTVAKLARKVLQAGERLVVVSGDDAQRTHLSQVLWQQGGAAFLANGMAGGAHEARQPILLTTGADSPNDPHCIMTIDGAEVAAEEVQRLDRVCVLFDGNDEAALQTARGQWKALTDAGCSAQYWSEESGRWEKKAEK